MANTTPSPTPLSQPPSVQSTGSNFDKEHYNNLISSVKWILGLAGASVSVIVTVALVATWQDRKEYKEEIRSTLAEVKADLKDTKSEYLTTLKDIKSEANGQVDNLKKQMSDQISIIKGNAENLAMATVQKTLNEQFETRNIQNLISKTADERLQGQVGSILEQKIKKKTEDIDEQTEAVSFLSIAVDQIRNGDRRWFDKVDSIRQFHKLIIIKKLAESLLIQKIEHYKAALNYDQNSRSMDSAVYIPFNLIDSPSDTVLNVGVDLLILTLVKDIAVRNDLTTITSEFITLIKLTGKIFKLFNFKEVKDWFKYEYPGSLPLIQKRLVQRRFLTFKGLGYGPGENIPGTIILTR